MEGKKSEIAESVCGLKEWEEGEKERKQEEDETEKDLIEKVAAVGRSSSTRGRTTCGRGKLAR